MSIGLDMGAVRDGKQDKYKEITSRLRAESVGYLRRALRAKECTAARAKYPPSCTYIRRAQLAV